MRWDLSTSPQLSNNATIAARSAAIAILDVVSRKWLTTLVSAEESSTQVEVAFTAALDAEGLLALAGQHASERLRAALAAGDADTLAELTAVGDLPLLLAISDNGPQMRSLTTREFMARPGHHPTVRPAAHTH